MKKVLDRLYEYQDLKYKEFSSKIIPNINSDLIIGVKTPNIRKIAKELIKEKDYKLFMMELPHKYQEENLLHSELVSLNKDIDETISELNTFLPYVDNWAVCDTISPKAFKNDYKKSLKYIKSCLKSKETYKIRFGIVSLLQFFLDDEYKEEYNDLVLQIKNDDYYIRMSIAWYFSFALIKQYDSTIKIFEEKKLDKWTHNKSIQKFVESFRVSEERKKYLKSLKVK